jgi:hypothetical protein
MTDASKGAGTGGDSWQDGPRGPCETDVMTGRTGRNREGARRAGPEERGSLAESALDMICIK